MVGTPSCRSFVTIAACAATFGCASFEQERPIVQATPTQTPSAPMSRGDGYYASAVAAIERKDYVRALEALQEARTLNAGDIRVLNAFGVVYDKLGRFDLSARYYAQAKAIDADSPVVQANMAYSAILSGTAPAAQALATQAPAPPAAPTQTRPLALAVAVADPAPPPPRVPAASPIPAKVAAAPVLQRAEPRLLAKGPVFSVPRTAAAPAGIATTPAPQPALPRVLTKPTAPSASTVAQRTQAPARAAKPPQASASAARPAPATVAVSATPRPVRAVPKAIAPPAPTVVKAPTQMVARQASGPVFSAVRPPLYIVNASGQASGGEPIRVALASKGWSTPKWALQSAPTQQRSTIHYPPSRRAVAVALSVTLPSRPQLAPCACAGLKLVLGADATRWRPMGARPSAKSRSKA